MAKGEAQRSELRLGHRGSARGQSSAGSAALDRAARQGSAAASDASMSVAGRTGMCFWRTL